MNLDFTEEQEMLRTSARDFLSTECPKTLVRELEESEEGYSADLWKKMADLGWMGLVIPDDFGGMGMEFFDLVILLEEMGRNILPGPFFTTVVLGALPIMDAGTEEQKKEYLPKIAEGDALFTMALTEPSATYEPSGVELKATAQGDDFVLNGTKLFVEMAHVADYMIVAARSKEGGAAEDGVTLFVVDAKSPGIKCEVMPTIGADKLCEVVFNNVSVPRANVLGEVDKGWPVVERALQHATMAKCAEMLGGAEASLDMTADYAKERVLYGRPIASFQVLQHYMANMLINLETARNLIYETAWMVSAGMPSKQLVAAAKGWINEGYKFITERAVQIHGAIGTTRDHDIGLYYRRALASDLAFGNTDYQRELVARELGM
ncbi:MAG: acyl-CoA dehydrogenase family protein [Chloroflexota bacterium]|nr:acyl-CoA dehydrogenase family protein [Chloroflexota bacterium]